MSGTAIDQIQTAQIATLFGIINGGGGVPTATNLAGGIASQIPYQSAPNTTSFIPNGTSGQFLKSNGTAPPSFDTLPPPFVAPTLDQVLSAGNQGNPAQTIILNGGGQYDDITYSSTGILGGSAVTITSTNNPLTLNASAGNIDMNAGDQIDLTAGSYLNITSLDNMSISTTGVGQNIDISASESMSIIAVADTLSLEAQSFLNLRSNIDDINLTAFNNGTTQSGQVYINKNLVNTGDGILNVGKINLSNPLGELFLIDTGNSVTNTIKAIGSVVLFDDGITTSTTTFGIDGIQHIGDNLYLTTNGTLGFSSDNITANSAGLAITSNIANSIPAPTLQIINTSTTAGTTNGVPSVQYYKSGRNGANNDIICSQSFNGKNSTGVKTEFAKIETTIRNVGVGNDDGSISIFATLNGVSTEFMRINGADGDNNFLRPLDMNGSAINSSSGSMSISTSASSGTGTITITPKVAGNLIFQNLPTSAVGLPTGAVWNNLGVLNIKP